MQLPTLARSVVIKPFTRPPFALESCRESSLCFSLVQRSSPFGLRKLQLALAEPHARVEKNDNSGCSNPL